jgi:glycosyltransferase involved in cell wall biosynthesis
MANLRVTVCIPTWNGERFIGETVQGVLTQGFADLEVITTDDQSTDSTVEIVRSFSNPRIGLHENEERLGITQKIGVGFSSQLCSRLEDHRVPLALEDLNSPMLGVRYGADRSSRPRDPDSRWHG